MKAEKPKRTNIAVDSDVVKRLRIWCLKNGWTLTAFVRHMFEVHLHEQAKGKNW